MSNENEVNYLVEEMGRRSSDSFSLLNSIELNEIESTSSDESHRISSSHVERRKLSIDDDSTDEFLIFDWDRERNLYHDYVQSLRKEIRLLLDEREELFDGNSSSETKKKENFHKTIEEKNFLIEKFQNELDGNKETNLQLKREISIFQLEKKSNSATIEDLKKKINDLSVDLENQNLVKQRLESSIEHLEHDCKTIDAERMKLFDDLQKLFVDKQETEKNLQKSNVRIAEQGFSSATSSIGRSTPKLFFSSRFDHRDAAR